MRRDLLKQLAAIGIYLLTLFMLTLYIPTRWDYVVRAEFREVPLADKELEQWLLEQPGVDMASIHRDGKQVVVTWGNNRVYAWNPSTVNLWDEFERFGYKGVVTYEERKDYRDRVGG